MKRRFLFIAILMALIVIGCSEKKVEQTVDQQTIERVARIAAMLEVDEGKALEIMITEKITVDQYKEIMAAISLDREKTNTFVQLKVSYTDQYTK